MAELYLGMARARVGPAAALVDAERGAVAACEENRLTRARHTPAPGPPALALAELLGFLDRSPSDVSVVAVVGDAEDRLWTGQATPATPVDGHEAHATYAFHASGLADALVLVCEVHKPRGWSAWRPDAEGHLHEVGQTLGEFPLARVYGVLTETLGLTSMRDEHLVEAMARAGSDRFPAIADLITLTDAGMVVDSRFGDEVRDAVAGADADTARRDVATSVQRRLRECLIHLLGCLRTSENRLRAASSNLCLSGGLFFNTSFTTAAATADGFEQVYVPPHPGRNGTALGAALVAGAQRARRRATALGTPYLGPGYSDGQIKEALDNCKLSYDFVQGDRLNEVVIRDLARGHLVGWFHGRLEWGPRALGHRSVLADPFAPHALENLNGFLKRRAWYRSYGVSVPRARVNEYFEASGAAATSPFMQFEYRPHDPEKFRTILPPGVETLRVHTVDQSEPRFLRLLEMWGEKSGTPVLVNTSFNGFHEPLVCSPRDAIRVFYGTGLDVLALGDFLLRK